MKHLKQEIEVLSKNLRGQLLGIKEQQIGIIQMRDTIKRNEVVIRQKQYEILHLRTELEMNRIHQSTNASNALTCCEFQQNINGALRQQIKTCRKEYEALRNSNEKLESQMTQLRSILNPGANNHDDSMETSNQGLL